MKKFAVFSLVFLLIIPFAAALPNPAALYCEESGFTYMKVETANGTDSVCVLPGETCDSWDFYNGECGEEYGMSFSLFRTGSA